MKRKTAGVSRNIGGERRTFTSPAPRTTYYQAVARDWRYTWPSTCAMTR
jgi:hypothetical protein